MTNIAILSTAHIHTRQFLKNINESNDGRTAHVIWDDHADRGQAYAQEFGSRFEADLEAVLADEAIDGFLICAENTRHVPLLERVIAVEKPVFCEKPLCTDLEELSRVESLIERHAPVLFCGYFQPFGGQMRAIRQLIAEGRLGRITHARFRNAHHAAYGRWFDKPELQWFTEPSLSGGGAFMDMGAHAVHLLASLFGDADKVWAHIANHAGVYPAVDDFGIAHVVFSSGVQACIEAAWIHQGGPDGLEVHGSDGAIWKTADGYVLGKPGQQPVPVEALAEQPTRVDRLVAAIRGELSEAELAEDLAACIAAVRITVAAYRASERGSWVELAAQPA